MKHSFAKNISNFWYIHPALLCGVSLLLGTLFSLQTPLVLIPLFLLISTVSKKQVALLICFFLLPLPYHQFFYSFPATNQAIQGKLSIQSVALSQGFSNGWAYRGTLKTKEGTVPVQITSKTRYPSNQIYHLQGKVRKKAGTFYVLKTFDPWVPHKKTTSLADWRYQAKEKVREYIYRFTPHERVAHFLTGIVTGQMEDRVMQSEFSLLGLSHIMAISGFHFALLTLAFHLFLRLFLPPKMEASLLIIVAFLYLVFIGFSPSVLRAWLMTTLLLGGQLIERRNIARNALGVALLVTLLLNPLYALTLSFQLSFLATAGILLLHEPCNRLLNFWIEQLPLKKVVKKGLFAQQMYVIVSLFRETLALTLAVHLALLPLLLSAFHTFSLNSIFYNLFFPFLTTIALFGFLLGLLLGPYVHLINSYYCNWMLLLTENPPLLFKSFYIDAFPPNWLIMVYLVLLFTAAIGLRPASRSDDWII